MRREHSGQSYEESNTEARTQGRASYQHAGHGFPPCFDSGSRILILGSFPSVRSREVQFYYGHPQNRFWALLALLRGDTKPESEEEKRIFLRKHHIALYDTIESCDLIGSSDASIRNAEPADLGTILAHAPIRQIFTNGSRSHAVYQKYQFTRTGRGDIPLPSTSPANAAWSLERLAAAWKVINEYLDD